MTDRLLITIVILAVIVLAGVIVRGVAARRDARVIAYQTLPGRDRALPHILTFSGPWCAECRTQRRIIDEVIATTGCPVEVDAVDVLAESALAKRFGVMTVPTTVIAAADGTIAAINRGLVTGERLRAQLATVAATADAV